MIVLYAIYVLLCCALAVFCYWGGYRDGEKRGTESGYRKGYLKGYAEAIDNVGLEHRDRDSPPRQTWPPAWGVAQ